MGVLGDLVVRLIGDTKPLKTALGHAEGLLGGFGTTIASTFAAGAAVHLAGEQLRAEKKLGAVLAATGHAAGFEAEELKRLAANLQGVTNFADETTISAMAVLATFNQIKGPIFTEAIKSAQDMSTVLGTDLQSSVVLIGKALQNPISGLTQLQKKGVQFTEAQKDQIKAMVEAGNVMGAQKLILGELSNRFGGAAKAMASPIVQLKNTVADLGEQVGMLMLPTLKAMAAATKAFLDAWGNKAVQIAGAVLALIAVLKGITLVQKAIAVGQALIMSLAGPAGWAQLAAGAIVFTGALIAIRSTMGEVTSGAGPAIAGMAQLGERFEDMAGGSVAIAKEKVDEFAKALDALRSPADVLDAKLADLKKTAEAMGGQAMTDFSLGIKPNLIAQATGFTDKMKSLRDEIRALQPTANATADAIVDMINAGASAGMAQQFEDMAKQRDAIKAQKDAMDKLKGTAASIFDATRTPAENFAKAMADADAAFKAGLIDQTTLNRFRDQEQAKLAGKPEEIKAEIARGPEAASLGSSSALSSIFASMRDTNDPQKQLVKLQQDANKEQESQSALLQDIANGFQEMEVVDI